MEEKELREKHQVGQCIEYWGEARKNVSDVEAQPRGDGQEKKGTVEVSWGGETVFITCELEPLKGVELGTGPTF